MSIRQYFVLQMHMFTYVFKGMHLVITIHLPSFGVSGVGRVGQAAVIRLKPALIRRLISCRPTTSPQNAVNQHLRSNTSGNMNQLEKAAQGKCCPVRSISLRAQLQTLRCDVLERADTAVTKLQISPVIVNGFKNGFHQQIQRIFLVVVEAEKYFSEQGGQKSKLYTLVDISTKQDRFLKFFHCYTQQEICNKRVITYVTTPKKCHYTTLQNINFQKSHRLKAQQRQTGRAHAEENVTAVGELVAY